MLNKVKHISMITGVALILGVGVSILCSAFDYNTVYEDANVWYKVSTDNLNPGEVVALDMSYGYAMCDVDMVYLVVHPVDSEEEIIIAFPNGKHWKAPDVDTMSIEIQKAFGKLEQDLMKK
tara:strand:+ start:542 stop:904 length:363 start_codon:yes stop_codon:yes gene_type:complete